MEDFHYARGIWDVQQLLKEWKLENIWPHLLAQKIDGEVLQMIKIPHIRMLLGNFPLGIQIRFEHNLEQWRFNIGRPLQQQYRCEGRCEFEIYKPSSSLAHPHPHHYSHDFSQHLIPNGVELYSQTKQKDKPLLVETTPPKKKPITPPKDKDALITNNQTPPETPTTRSQASTPSNKNEAPEPYTTKPQGPVPKVKLREILINCRPEGPQLMEIYKNKNTFSWMERRNLVSALVHYYLRNDMKFCLQTSYALERAILKMFPNERLDMYRRSKRGSIYCKYTSVKPLYNKKPFHINSMQLRKDQNDGDGCDNNSEMETACFSDETSSQLGHGDAGIRNSSDCYSLNEDDYAPTVSNMAHDNDGDADVDGGTVDQKSQYSFSYLQNRDVEDVKPTIIEDSVVTIQTAYMLHREVIRLQTPLLYETFLQKACTIFSINSMENLYLTVNGCKIEKYEFESVIRQYYKLPTFVVELRQKLTPCTISDQNNNDITHFDPQEDDRPNNKNSPTFLPSAKDIRNIPPLRHIVLLSNASHPLENKHRTSIAKAVIDECLSLHPDRGLKRQEYLILARRICEAFPGENESTYYVPSQPNHLASGKLRCYFKNKRHFLSTIGVVKTRALKRQHLKQQISEEDDDESDQNLC